MFQLLLRGTQELGTLLMRIDPEFSKWAFARLDLSDPNDEEIAKDGFDRSVKALSMMIRSLINERTLSQAFRSLGQSEALIEKITMASSAMTESVRVTSWDEMVDIFERVDVKEKLHDEFHYYAFKRL
jgi:hypothetical protein